MMETSLNFRFVKVIIILTGLLQSCLPQKPIVIAEFSTYSKPIDTTISRGKEMIYFNGFFLVSNYKDSKKIALQLDSFVQAYTSKKNYPQSTEEIRFYFYKETSKTNLIEIERNPREVDRYSNEHDLIYYYAVKLNKEMVREKYKNGEIIEIIPKPTTPTPKFKIEKVED